MTIDRQISLLPYNTFGIEATASVMLTYDSLDDIPQVLNYIQCHPEYPVLHIGAGSNLLFLDDYHGIVLYSQIRDIEIMEVDGNQITVRVGAGWVMDDFIAHCINQGWYGLENLSLIPGQVGASAVQNIGAYGVEAGDNIVRVHCVDLHTGESRIFEHDECQYSYRYSIFKSQDLRGRYAVTHVEYRLSKTFLPKLEYGGIRSALQQNGINTETLTAQQLRETIIDIRQQKLPDPKVLGNAGSFFMNPVVDNMQFQMLLSKYPDMPHYVVDDRHVKIPAGWMIDQCGWKGRSLGPAAVHDRQALVLVNKGGAKGQDVVALSDAIRADVFSRFAIDIHPEVNFI